MARKKREVSERLVRVQFDWREGTVAKIDRWAKLLGHTKKGRKSFVDSAVKLYVIALEKAFVEGKSVAFFCDGSSDLYLDPNIQDAQNLGKKKRATDGGAK